jgi:hypothetical protein
MYRDYYADYTTGRYLFLRALKEESHLEIEIFALKQLRDIYDKLDLRLHVQFYEEVVLAKEMPADEQPAAEGSKDPARLGSKLAILSKYLRVNSLYSLSTSFILFHSLYSLSTSFILSTSATYRRYNCSIAFFLSCDALKNVYAGKVPLLQSFHKYFDLIRTRRYEFSPIFLELFSLEPKIHHFHFCFFSVYPVEDCLLLETQKSI